MDYQAIPERNADLLAEWQLEEILRGIEEADRGEFATDQEARHAIGRWTRRANST